MTTFEYATARTQSILSRLVLMVAPRRRALAAVLARGWAKVRPVAMTTLGLGCIVAGLFTVSLLAGLLGAGVSFFLIDYAAEKRR
jgi:hypothetical protein